MSCRCLAVGSGPPSLSKRERLRPLRRAVLVIENDGKENRKNGDDGTVRAVASPSLQAGGSRSYAASDQNKVRSQKDWKGIGHSLK